MPDVQTCPYRGLSAFREKDAPLFFGREAFSQTLAEQVQQEGLVAVVGPSGSGKSSVVFAGLVPIVRRRGTWLIVDFRPGKEPFRALAAALLPWLEPEMTQTDRLVEETKLSQALLANEVSLPHLISRILGQPEEGRLLLVGDQFEELYTLCSEPATRQAFLEQLLALAAEPGLGAVVLTLRADFMEQALAYRPFADVLQGNVAFLGPMNEAELGQAITRPSQLGFEPGLVVRILEDVQNQPGSLPLLEFALTLLWERQEGGRLTHAAYERIGRVEGALAQHADEQLATLTTAEQEQARHIFIQLTQPGEGTEDTRRLARKEEMGEESWPLLQKLADARLIVTNQGVDGGGNGGGGA